MDTLEERWRRRFENFGRGYDEDHLISGWSEQGLRQRIIILKEIFPLLPQTKIADILDLGCGPGTYVRCISGQNGKVVGMDYSIPSLKKAQTKDSEKKGEYIGGDAYNLPFQKNSFDLVLSIGTMQTFRNPEKILHEISRVLRPDGILILEFLNYCALANYSVSLMAKIKRCPPRIRSYSCFEVKKMLLDSHFQPILRKGIYLLPRSMASLSFVLEHKLVNWAMSRTSGLSAHAFLLCSKNIKRE